MRRLLRSVAELFVPDQKGHRAIEETLADWRQDRSQATTVGIRLIADLRGVASVLRVFAIVARFQIGDRQVWRPFGWTVAISVAVGAALMIRSLRAFPLPISSAEQAGMAAMLLPSAFVVVFGLVGSVGLGTRQSQAAPLIGQTVAATILMIVLLGWVVPAANQEFRLRAFAAWSRDASPGGKLVRPPVAGLAELSLPQVVAAWRSDLPHEAAAAARALSTTGALAFAAPTFLVLGVAVRRRWIPRGSWRLAQAASGAGAVAATVTGVLLTRWLPDAYPPVFLLFERLNAQLWLTLAVAWVITIAALRARHPAHAT